MNEQIRITQGRPQVRDTEQNPALRPAAQEHNYGIANVQPDADLAGLVEGLKAFNPALEQWNQNAREDAITQAKAASATNEAPRDALTGQPLQVPEKISPAYARDYKAAFATGLAQRVAVQNKMDAIREYNDNKDDPSFDVGNWLNTSRQKAMAGVTDPHAQAIIGQHFDQLELEVQGEAEKARLKRVEEARSENVSAALTGGITVDMPATDMRSAYDALVPEGIKNGKTRPEMAEMLLMHLHNQSSLNGGMPEAFGVFNAKGPDGKSLLDYMPQLAPKVQSAIEHATQLRDKTIEEKTHVANETTLAQLDERVLKDPMSFTLDEVMGYATPKGVLGGKGQGASFWSKVLEHQQKFLGTQQMMGLAGSGQLFRLEAGKQNQVMDSLFAPKMDQLMSAVQSGDLNAVSQRAGEILRMHSQVGATVAWDQLKGFLSTTVTNSPNPNGPTPAFTAAKELYRVMSATPKYRDLYFGEDVSKVMDSYIASEKAQSDPKASYVQAYQSISPEAKAAADAYAKTPDFLKMTTAEAQKWVTGSSMNWLKVFGSAGRPVNGDVVGSALAQEMRSWRARNPFVGTDKAEDYAHEWVERNFIIDKTSGAAIRVPPRYSAPAVQEAMSNYSADLAKRLNLDSRSDPKWSVQYIPLGTEGKFQPVLVNGAAMQSLPPVNVDNLLAREAAKKVFSPEEAQVIGSVKVAMAKGLPVPPISRELVAKAEMLKAFNPAEVKTFTDAYNKQAIDRINSIPQFTLGNPTSANLQFIPQKGNVKVDNQLTAQAARDLIGTPVAGPGQNHMGYAASLVTMAEGMALRRYPDPANEAGDNIAMGYNLKANAKNVDADLKRAGVPDDQIENVKAGKADLTPDQAKRLTLVALPRYEQQVKEVASATSPGLWERMLPAQKAVMIDIAYQVGSTDQFKKAWAALAKGDMQAFANEAKSTYVDRSGNRVEDTRRNNLRAAMLSGTAQWDATVGAYGSLPATKLAAMK